ncbi:MAG: hypothetical protein OEV43_00100 [Coriobacteriia bacterium]|nr:hypothetical protein [Coriobacteriia bacterium]
MAADRQRNALQVIFSFFLGLMVTAFIGVGVNTFYQSPEVRYQDEIDELVRQEEDVYITQDAEGPLSAQDEATLEEIRREIRALEDKRQSEWEPYARNTSIILILFATLVMGISLMRSEQLRIISNGLLLGGLFTMLYGTGWVIASGSSLARFAVMTFALVVTFALGYARFVRSRGVMPAAARTPSAAVASDAEVSSLEARVTALERRTAKAASALTHDED